MLSRCSSSSLLTQPFLPSISTLGPDPTYHHPSNTHQTNQQQQQNHQHQQQQHQQQQQQQQQQPLHSEHELHLPNDHHFHQSYHPHFKQEESFHYHHQPMLSSPTLPNNNNNHHNHPSYLPHPHPHLQHPQQQLLPAHHHPHHLIRRSVSSSTVSGRPPPKTSRRQSKLNNLDRRRICEYAAAHPKSTQEDIALQWGIDRSSVSKILKYRDKWLSISPTARAAKVIKHRGGRFPQLESEVVRRCKQKSLAGGFLGDRTIKDLALDVSQEMGLGQGAFKASNGWLDAFKERAQIKGGRFLDSNRPHSTPTSMIPHPNPHRSDHTHQNNQNTSAELNLSSPDLVSSASIGEQRIVTNEEIDDLDEEDEEEEEEEDEDEEEEGEEEEEEEEEEEGEEEEEEEADDQTQLVHHDRNQEQEAASCMKAQQAANDHQSISPHGQFDRSIDSEPMQDQFPRSSTPSDAKQHHHLHHHTHHHHPSSAPTPPLSSSNSSTSQEDGSHGVKMDSLKSSIDRIIAPTSHSSDLSTPIDTHDPSSQAQPDQHDAMDGIEQLANDSGSADQTIVFKYPPSFTSNNNNTSSNTHQTNPYSRPFNNNPSNDHHGQAFARRQASSNHSRSSSVSIGSLSSVYGGDDYHLNSPGIKVHPTHQLSSYSSHPNFHPPPLRTTPVRRTFPGLRHAMSQPAINSQTNATHGAQSSQPPILPPMSATASSPQGHQYASFSSHPYSFSPLSAPLNHSNRSNSRLELAPVCPSRIGHLHSHHPPPHHRLASQRDDGVEWPSDELGVGFDEALGALETVMRFLQDQPTSFATPRDYMVVGELFGRMKEKKQEMMSIGANTNNSGNNNNNNGMNLNGLPRRLMTSGVSSSSNGNGSNGMNSSSSNKSNMNPIRHHRSASQQHQLSAPSNGAVATSPLNGLDLVKEDSQSDQMEH